MFSSASLGGRACCLFICFFFIFAALLVRFTTGRFIHEYDPTLGKLFVCLFVRKHYILETSHEAVRMIANFMSCMFHDVSSSISRACDK